MGRSLIEEEKNSYFEYKESTHIKPLMSHLATKLIAKGANRNAGDRLLGPLTNLHFEKTHIYRSGSKISSTSLPHH